MARDFTKNAGNYLTMGNGILATLLNGAARFSVHSWLNFDTTNTAANNNRILTALINAAGNSALILNVENTDGTRKLKVSARSQAGDSIQTRTGTTDLQAGTNYSLGAVIDIAGDAITPYVNGAAEGGGAVTFGAAAFTNGGSQAQPDGIGTSSSVPATADQTDGRIGEVAFWLDDIGPTGFAALALGFSPLFVKPQSLVFYMRLFGTVAPERDIVGNKAGSITGTINGAAHFPIIYPSRKTFRMNANDAVPAAPAHAGPGGVSSLRGLGRLGL